MAPSIKTVHGQRPASHRGGYTPKRKDHDRVTLNLLHIAVYFIPHQQHEKTSYSFPIFSFTIQTRRGRKDDFERNAPLYHVDRSHNYYAGNIMKNSQEKREEVERRW
jgi:hypothetical protein